MGIEANVVVVGEGTLGELVNISRVLDKMSRELDKMSRVLDNKSRELDKMS